MAAFLMLLLALGASSARAEIIAPLAGVIIPTETIIGIATNTLGNKEFSKREWASRALVDIGGPALPAVREAWRSSDDAEVRRRAEAAYYRIMRDIYAKPELSEAALQRIESLRKDMTDSGRALTGKPSAEWIAGQEKLIAASDRLLNQKLGGMNQDEVDVRLAAFRENPPKRLDFKEQERNRQALIFLSEAAAITRLGLARAYSLSEDQEQRKKAVDQLIQTVQLLPASYMKTGTPTALQGNGATYEHFLDIAVRIGARNNPDFVKALPKSSADETLDRLRQLELPPE